jgi:hypothetical protein
MDLTSYTRGPEPALLVIAWLCFTTQTFGGQDTLLAAMVLRVSQLRGGLFFVVGSVYPRQ